jgi:Rieske Fe-S protein
MTVADAHQNMLRRRDVLLGAGALGAVPVIAGCAKTHHSNPAATPAPPNQSTDNGAARTPMATVVVKVTDVPVGGGTVVEDQDTVITQPQAGHFNAFSATCTHLGCTVAGVSNGTINCPCHGSRYSITDGTVTDGPATKPLPAKIVTVNSDTLTISQTP